MGNSIINMKDCCIVDFNYETDYEQGECPTCNYGERFITKFIITMNKGAIEIKISDEDGYKLSESFFIKLFTKNYHKITNMTKKEFFRFLKVRFKFEEETVMLREVEFLWYN